MNRLKIGIRAHDLNNAPFNNTEELINEIKKTDIDYIQFVFKKAFTSFNMNEENLNHLSELFKKNNIKVSMIGAYFNMVHSNKEKRANDIAYFKNCLECANLFNTSLVGSETGSYNDDKWTYNPLNHTSEAYNEVLKVVKELKEYGKKYNSEIIIEGAYNHVIYEPVLLYKLVKELDLSSVTFDLFNYLNINNYQNHIEIFDQGIELLKDKIKIFHMKDFYVKDGKLIQTSLGEGLMDYNNIIPKIIKNYPNAYLILEGITKDNILSSVKFLRSFEND